MKITEILKQIKPYVLGWIEDFGTGGVSNKEVTDTLGSWWGGIILLKRNGPVQYFNPDDTGLALALAAATSGDSIWMPAGTWTMDVTLPTGISMVAMTNNTILYGLVTMGNWSSIKGITISRTANDANPLLGVVNNGANFAWIDDCAVTCTQSGSGEAVALSVSEAGDIQVYNSTLIATSSSGDSYGIKQTAGAVFVSDDGQVSGGTADIYGMVSRYDYEDEIKLLDSAGGLTRLYPATAAGLTAALGAATSGDVVQLPAGTLTIADVEFIVPSGVTLRGLSRERTILDFSFTSDIEATYYSTCVELRSHSVLENLTINAYGNRLTFPSETLVLTAVYITDPGYDQYGIVRNITIKMNIETPWSELVGIAGYLYGGDDWDSTPAIENVSIYQTMTKSLDGTDQWAEIWAIEADAYYQPAILNRLHIIRNVDCTLDVYLDDTVDQGFDYFGVTVTTYQGRTLIDNVNMYLRCDNPKAGYCEMYGIDVYRFGAPNPPSYNFVENCTVLQVLTNSNGSCYMYGISGAGSTFRNCYSNLLSDGDEGEMSAFEAGSVVQGCYGIAHTTGTCLYSYGIYAISASLYGNTFIGDTYDIYYNGSPYLYGNQYDTIAGNVATYNYLQGDRLADKNQIHLYNGDGSLSQYFYFTSAGLISALAIATSGDKIQLPEGTIAITSELVIGSGVTLQGMNKSKTALTFASQGNGATWTPITAGNAAASNAIIRDLTITLSITHSITTINGVIIGGGRIYDVDFYALADTGASVSTINGIIDHGTYGLYGEDYQSICSMRNVNSKVECGAGSVGTINSINIRGSMTSKNGRNYIIENCQGIAYNQAAADAEGIAGIICGATSYGTNRWILFDCYGDAKATFATATHGLDTGNGIYITGGTELFHCTGRLTTNGSFYDGSAGIYAQYAWLYGCRGYATGVTATSARFVDGLYTYGSILMDCEGLATDTGAGDAAGLHTGADTIVGGRFLATNTGGGNGYDIEAYASSSIYGARYSTSTGTIVYLSGDRRSLSIPATKTTTYAITRDNEVILCDATGGAFDVDLPAVATSKGWIETIKKIDSSANAVTIDADGSETIDGATTQVINYQWTAIQIVCDGAAWYIV